MKKDQNLQKRYNQSNSSSGKFFSSNYHNNRSNLFNQICTISVQIDLPKKYQFEKILIIILKIDISVIIVAIVNKGIFTQEHIQIELITLFRNSL